MDISAMWNLLKTNLKKELSRRAAINGQSVQIMNDTANQMCISRSSPRRRDVRLEFNSRTDTITRSCWQATSDAGSTLHLEPPFKEVLKFDAMTTDDIEVWVINELYNRPV